jgi:hypothetical protein
VAGYLRVSVAAAWAIENEKNWLGTFGESLANVCSNAFENRYPPLKGIHSVCLRYGHGKSTMCRSCPNRKTMEFHSYYLPGWTLSGAAWQQHDLQNGFAMRSLVMAEMRPDPRLFSWVPIHPQQDWRTRKITRWHQTSWFVGQPPWWVALEAIIEGLGDRWSMVMAGWANQDGAGWGIHLFTPGIQTRRLRTQPTRGTEATKWERHVFHTRAACFCCLPACWLVSLH